MDNDDMEVVVEGRALGTASGWDQAGETDTVFYDFRPRDGVALPACASLDHDHGTGWFVVYRDKGDEERFDAPTILVGLPRQTEKEGSANG